MMKTIVKASITAFLAVAVSISAIACTRMQKQDEVSPVVKTTPPTSPAVSSVQTMLLMSLVDYQAPSGGKTLRNNRQADFILLMTIDADQKKTTAIQIDPSIEVDFTPQGASNAEHIPIGEVFTYGSGGSDSNLNILTAVSKLMDHVRIDHYMTFEADSVCVMADMLKEITVTVTDSFPEAYPDLAVGNTVRLDGKNADVFFNYRAPEDSDNAAHMRRQQEFIKAVYTAFASRAGQEDFVTQLSMKLGEKMDTDLALSQMLKMMEILQEYKLDDSMHTVNKGDK